MDTVLTVVTPVFALIAIGYAAGRFGLMSDAGAKGLAEFTFNLAIPALLFRTMATAEMPDVSPYALWGSYFGSVISVWVLASVLTLVVLRRTAPESVSISMSSSFGNVVMIGMPICLNLYGDAAAAPMAIIISLHSPFFWTAGTLHLAVAKRDPDASILAILRGLYSELSRNMIILAIIAGTLWRFTGLEIPPLAGDVINFLGRAGIPCALVSLGLSLVGFRIAGQLPTLSTILVFKILIMPLVAWMLATHVFELPPVAAGIVAIFAGMPTGANAYLFAAQHQLAPHSASGAVALGTLVSAASATALVYLLQQFG